MNQDQVREIVNKVISERDPWVPFFVVLALFISLAAAAAFAYLKKYAENQAIKRDLSEMTDAVESIKTTYGKEIETLKALLGTKSHFSRLRYERETGVYKELWTALVELGEVTLFLRPFVDMVPSSETEDQRKARKATAFVEKHRSLHEIVTRNRPFYPSEVWQKLEAFLRAPKTTPPNGVL